MSNSNRYALVTRAITTSKAFDDLQAFADTVTKKLNDGWKLQGSLAVLDGTVLIQAFTKEA